MDENRGPATASTASQASAGPFLSDEQDTQTAAGDDPGRSGGGPLAEACSIYEQLADIDPMRTGYYEDAKAGRAHVVLNPERVA